MNLDDKKYVLDENFPWDNFSLDIHAKYLCFNEKDCKKESFKYTELKFTGLFIYFI